jgi:NADPH-dependent 2,4-dienoyl-CoA reductase/sulfur reductase-like enzyme
MSADLVIIGAGPAGMAAARVAAEGGLSVTLLDEQERAGGQIYRNVGAVAGRGWLGADYSIIPASRISPAQPSGASTQGAA